MNPIVKKALYIVVCIFILLGGAIGAKKIIESKKEIKRRARPKPLPPAIFSIAKPWVKGITVYGDGTVRPYKKINMVPQVSGKVIYVAPSFINGGRFKKGDALIKIDPVDYEIALVLAEAKVKEAESNLALATEESRAARDEWNMIHGRGSSKKQKPSPLVLKIPQLNASKAVLEASKAELKKARLNLQRTTLYAPFDGVVMNENVDVGQYVIAGQALGTIFSTDAVEIIVPVEMRDIPLIDIPGFTVRESNGSRAYISARIGIKDYTWKGKVVRSEGRLDETTRMLNVIVRVDKPYETYPPLAIGMFVKVRIEGRTMEKILEIPASALRDNKVVWVIDNTDRIRFRKVRTLKVYRDKALIENGIKEGDRVVVSLLKVVTDGMKVKPVEQKEAGIGE